MSYLREKLPEFSPAVVEMEPWRKALMDAAEYIRVHGWTQGRCERAGAVCMFGAIIHTTGGFGDHEIWNSVERLVGGNPVLWNDTPGRTAAEVIAALEAAARS